MQIQARRDGRLPLPQIIKKPETNEFLQSKRLERGAEKETRTLIAALILALVFIALDQITKAAVVKYIRFGERIPVIPDFFNLTYITNTGAAWGILAGHGWLLLLISFAVLIAVIYFIHTLTDGWPERIYAIALIVSGIVGNSIDRIFRREVVDFLQFLFGKYQYPSFNIADSCICVGVFIFILSTVLRPDKKKPEPDSSYVQLQK